jgi:glycerophosphoryl diester phosphodiesterase
MPTIHQWFARAVLVAGCVTATVACAESDAERTARQARVAERRVGPAVIVHRGAWAFAPENSLAAYAAAMDYGADGCEVDIRRTRDGVLVLFHDDMLDRLTCGSVAVNELTHRELLALRSKRQFGRALYSGAPTFAELLTLARQRAMLLHLDVKEPGLEDDIARQLDDADMWDHVVSINTYNTARLRQHPKFKPLAYKGPGLSEKRLDMDPDAVRAQLARPGQMIMVDDPRVAARILKREPNPSAPPVEPVSQVPVVTKSVADLIAAFRRKESSPLADYRAKMHILPALGELRCAESKQFLLEYVAGAHDRPQFEDATLALLCQQLTDDELAALLRSTNSAVRGTAILECVDRPTPQRRRALQAAAPWALELPSAAEAPRTFFAVHCEAHSANPAMWDALCRFVEMADRYETKLTLMFNPLWAEFIVPNKERFERVKSWQKNGHEVAVHFHNIVHGDWNGHTNRDAKKNDRRYRGTVAEMMSSLQKLAAPDTMLTMCMGPDARWDSLSEVEIDEPDYPDGILYDVDGMNVGLTRLMKTKFRGRDLLHLKHHFFAPGHREEHLDKIKEEFRRAKPGEVLGVVTHELDFARSPEFIEKWFQFCRENNARIRTVRDIVKTYPADQIVEVKWVRQEPGPQGIFVKARKFQDRLKAAKAQHRDTSAAEELDRQSRAAAARGDMAEAERLLEKAIAQFEQGFITFAVNVHDWPHLEESAATVLRLIGIFEKHKVRGDFYFTPQIVEHYAQKRPDVIERIKQSGMGVSYHLRPPHPTNAGFEGRLRDLDDSALAQTLRDYETYRLDPTTGELQRDKPGGYSYVAQVFGRKPVVVSPQARDPRIRAAALKVYAALGAKMVVAYHESGTKLEQPFEWIHGLLARPSDFSVTRLERDVFWWNAPGSDPVALLQRQLAEWHGSRPPFITALIHENDFSREGGPGWNAIYYAGEGPRSRPKRPPFDLNTPDRSRPRSAEAREKIWKAYEGLVAYAATNLRVVTSEAIVALAKGVAPQ